MIPISAEENFAPFYLNATVNNNASGLNCSDSFYGEW